MKEMPANCTKALFIKTRERQALYSIMSDPRCTPEQRLQSMVRLDAIRQYDRDKKDKRKVKKRGAYQIKVKTNQLSALISKIESTA